MDGTDAAIDILSEHFLDQIDYDGKQSYSRYWHGYLIFLKPLLLLLNYSQIRIINLICQSILLIIVFLLMLKKQLKELIVPYFIMYLLLMPAALVMNMQFYPCFYLILIGSITVFLFSNQKIFPFVFLLLGVTTSYFDFLTYPFATLGVPLLILIYILIKNGMPNEDLIIIVFQLSVFWGIGYIGMWIMKWLLGSILLGGNVFYDAINAIRFRTSSNYDEFRYSRIGVVFTNVFTFLFSPASLLFISFVLVKSIKKPFNKKSIPLICIIAELACWYMVTVNHCAIHYWFTNKCSAVFVLSIMMCLLISKNSTSKCQNIT